MKIITRGFGNGNPLIVSRGYGLSGAAIVYEIIDLLSRLCRNIYKDGMICKIANIESNRCAVKSLNSLVSLE